MCMDMFSGPPDYAGQAVKQEKKRQKLITEGTGNINSAFAGFNPEFYNQRAAAYQQWAMPQLSRQYEQMRRTMSFGLANRGIMNSSAAQGQYSSLNREMGTQKQAIADVGRGQAQDLQKQVEAQRNVLLGQLYDSANPTMAGQQATATAASMASPSVYAPLGNMFSNLLQQYYAKQLMDTYKPGMMAYPAYGGGMGGGYPLPSVTYGGRR